MTTDVNAETAKTTSPSDKTVPTQWQDAEPGVTRRLVAIGDHMTGMEVRFEAGAEGALHHHPHEQVSHVLEGSFTFSLGGTDLAVKAGDTVRIPGGVPHGVVAHERSRLLDVFSPPREDLLEAMLAR